MAVTFWILLPAPHPENSQFKLEQEKKAAAEEHRPSFGQELKTRFSLIPGLFKYMIPLGCVYLFEYFINQGLFELIYFEDEFINHDYQYKVLQVSHVLV